MVVVNGKPPSIRWYWVERFANPITHLRTVAMEYLGKDRFPSSNMHPRRGDGGIMRVQGFPICFGMQLPIPTSKCNTYWLYSVRLDPFLHGFKSLTPFEPHGVME